ncbi:hypothetical protein GQ55_3G399900 [Panicum hallii var. hallii]|uniref:Bifunctional inhibitor/plant lipid transfer protein/seed storage helical domain-containing protein n=1 Tax=Panicum hallii var. hallii TaxID=1504633 RepID=A0A2T7EGU6_9POAL|nr:hypothetical protein GQ55_3G399900 [Panicum hallii var. hallii]
MGPTAARLLLLLLLLVAASLLPAPAASAADAPATASGSSYAAARDAAARCAATIVSISPCLPHVAAVAPPLAASPPAPTDACCVAFLRAVYPSGGGGGDGCLCHLLRNPFLLGFPVDAARLGALLPACAAGNSFAAATVEAATLFADACRELKALPELHVTPQSTEWLEISPAAATPQSMSKPMETVPPARSLVRSGADSRRSHCITIAVLILTAAAAGAVVT